MTNCFSDNDTICSDSRRPFSPKARLRNQAQLNYVRNTAQHFAGRYCVVLVAEPLEAGRKVGFANSRRFSTKAVIRNRARRLLREAYRTLLPHLADKWIILIPRHAIKNQKLADVLEDMRRQCRKAGILSEHEQETAGNKNDQ